MTRTFRLMFAGQPLPGIDPSELRTLLTDRLKLTPEQADQIFSGKTISLKRFNDRDEAERYQAHFIAMGAKVWIDIIEPVPSAANPDAKLPASPQAPTPATTAPITPAEEEIVCPKCGERQPKRTLCRKCAADMPRVLAAQKEAEMEARNAGLPAQDGQATPRRVNATAELALETPPIIGWGLHGRIGRLTYLLGNLAMTAIMVPIAVLGLKMGSLIFMAVLMLLAALVCLRLTALRCNDLGWSKWLTLIQLLPYVGAVFSLILLVLPGERGENAQGAPTPVAGWVPLAFCLVMAIGAVFSVRHEVLPLLMKLAAADGQLASNQSATARSIPHSSDSDAGVILYTDDSCPDCEKRRRELKNARIAYQEISLEKNPSGHLRLQESVARSGMNGQTVCTPILEFNGIVLPKEVGVVELEALLQAGR